MRTEMTSLRAEYDQLQGENSHLRNEVNELQSDLSNVVESLRVQPRVSKTESGIREPLARIEERLIALTTVVNMTAQPFLSQSTPSLGFVPGFLGARR